MSKQQAQDTAIARACAQLAEVDLPRRLAALELPDPRDGIVHLRMFGRDLTLTLDGLELHGPDHAPAKPAERILLLHYLLNENEIRNEDTPVAFREFAGGQFYDGPFRSRTVDPLVKRFGADLEGLSRNLRRFDWTSCGGADIAVRVHAFGPLRIIIEYQAPDSEMGASAEVLFTRAVHRALNAEDAVVLASRICIGLL